MPINEFNRIDEEYFETVLDEDFSFEGTVKSSESLIIKGQLKGCLESSGLVVVGPNSTLNAEVSSDQLQCFGHIVGDVFNQKDAIFYEESRVDGDITTDQLEVEKGCRINGKVTMKDKFEDNKNSEKINIK